MHAETIQWVGIQVGIWLVLSHSPTKTASVTLLFKMGRNEVARIICIRNLHDFFFVFVVLARCVQKDVLQQFVTFSLLWLRMCTGKLFKHTTSFSADLVKCAKCREKQNSQRHTNSGGHICTYECAVLPHIL